MAQARAVLVRVMLWVLALAAGIQGVRAAELVMFEDPGCPWCRRWHAEIGPGYPRTEEGRLAPLRRVDIKDQARAGVALKQPVTATPTFVLVEDGSEVGRLVGYPGHDFFYGLLGEVLARLPKDRGSSGPGPAMPASEAAAAAPM
jgi:hypothetical protein